jgi:F420-dependent methylenetetrahydromethanopterin dehydrogenase
VLGTSSRERSKTSDPRIQAYNTTVQDAKLIVVESCGSRPEAELVKGALEEAGIPAIIQGDTAGGMREHLAWSGAGFKILVREDDLTAARNFLASPAAGNESSDADSETDGDSLPPSRQSS